MPDTPNKSQQLFENLSVRSPELKERGYEAFSEDMLDDSNVEQLFNNLSAKSPELKSFGLEGFKSDMRATGQFDTPEDQVEKQPIEPQPIKQTFETDITSSKTRIDEERKSLDDSQNIFGKIIDNPYETRLHQASNLYDQASRYYDAVKDKSGGGKGILNAAADRNTWTMGATELSTMIYLGRIGKKLDKNEELDGSEVELLKAWDAKQEIEKKYPRSDAKLGYRVGEGITRMVPWLAQFAATGGFGTGAKLALENTLLKGAQKYLGKTAGKIATKAVGSVAGAYTQSALMPSTYADIIGRTLGNTEKGVNGEITFNDEAANSNVEAIYKGWTAGAIEVLTEKLGEGIQGLKIMKKLPKGRINARIFGDAGEKTSKVLDDFTKSVGWQGSPVEYLEEWVNTPLNALLVGDAEFSDMFNGPQQLETALTVVAMGGVMGVSQRGIQGVASTIDKKRNQKEEQEAYSGMNDALNETQNGKDIIKNVTSILEDQEITLEQEAAGLYGIMSNLPGDQSGAILNYVVASKKRKGNEQVDGFKQLLGVRETITQNIQPLINKQTGNVHIVANDNNEQFFVVDETEGGMYTVANQFGNKPPKDKNYFKDLAILSPEEFIAQQMGQFNQKQDAQELAERQAAHKQKQIEKIPTEFEYKGANVQFDPTDPNNVRPDGSIVVIELDEEGGVLGPIVLEAEEVAEVVEQNTPPEEQEFNEDGSLPQTEGQEAQEIVQPKTTLGGKEYESVDEEDGSLFLPGTGQKDLKAIQETLNENYEVELVTEDVESEAPASKYEKVKPAQTVVKGIRIREKPQQNNTGAASGDNNTSQNYILNEQEISRDDAYLKIELATTADELKGLVVNNDEELGKLINKKFPELNPTYKLNGKPITNTLATKAIASASNPEQLNKIEIKNDKEIQGLWANRKEELGLTQKENEEKKIVDRHNALVNEVKIYNDKRSPTSQETASIMSKAQEMGFKVGQKDGKIEVTNEDGKKIITKADRSKGKLTLKDLPEEHQGTIKTLLSSSEHLLTGLTPKQVSGAIKDIKEEKQSVPAQKLLESINKMAQDGFVEIKGDRLSGQPAIQVPIDEYLQSMLESEVSPEEETFAQSIPDEFLEPFLEEKDDDLSYDELTDAELVLNAIYDGRNEETAVETGTEDTSVQEDQTAGKVEPVNQEQASPEGIIQEAEEKPLTDDEVRAEYLRADIEREISTADIPLVAENELRSRFGIVENNGTQLANWQKEAVDNAEKSIRRKLVKTHPSLKKKAEPYDENVGLFENIKENVDKAEAVQAQQDAVSTPEIPYDESKDLFTNVAQSVERSEVANEEQKVNVEPSEAQKKAGNYKMGHVNIQGMDISIENPKGSERSGVDETGKKWSSKMNNTYGYFNRTLGKDGDQVNVFLGDNIHSDKAFIVDQINKDGSFDEHKTMIGFDNIEDAKHAYLANYEKGWTGLSDITEVGIEDFKNWIKDGKRTKKPYAISNNDQISKPAPVEESAQKGEVKEYGASNKNPLDKNVDAPALARAISSAFSDAFGTFKNNQERLVKAQKDFLNEKNLTVDEYQALPEVEKTKLIKEAKLFLDKNYPQNKQAIPQKGDKVKFDLGGREYTLPFNEIKVQPNGDIIFDLFGQKRLTQDNYEVVSNEASPSIKPNKATDKIDDFGDKIEGAKKDTYTRIQKLDEEAMSSQPLSKTFPKPDFQKLVEDGVMDKDGAMIMKFLYGEIPSKPRKKNRQKRWAESVQSAIDTYNDFIESKDNAKKFKDELDRSSKYSSLAIKFFKFEAIQKALGFPTVDINTGAYDIIKSQTKGEEEWYVVKGNFIVYKSSTLEGATEGLKGILSKNKEKSKGVKLSVYRDTKTGKYFIGKKGAVGVVRLIDGMERADAHEMYKTQQPQLQEMWNKLKLKPEERRKTNRGRVGTDYREGKDITPAEFTDKFGFRGTQFGNWVNNDERQTSLNRTHDALMDLSTVLGVSPRALSLGGELGMAFGARGSGGKNAAAAHYESGQVVINLTKNNGAGSLAHEWWHALDSYFSRKRGQKSNFLTQKPRQGVVPGENRNVVPDERIRTEMHDAFKSVVDAVNKSEMPQRSQELDKTRSQPYWSDIVEMSARSFENFIIEKLGDANEQNDYLANFKETGQWISGNGFDVDNYPYPLKDESPIINDNFQQLFDAIQEKEEGGKAILFRKQSPIGFYSPTEKALSKITQDKGTSGQFKNMLLKNGAKPAELDWMGWDDKFKSVNQKVTKKEVQDFIDQNKVEVEEVEKGESKNQGSEFTDEAQERHDELKNIEETGQPNNEFAANAVEEKIGESSTNVLSLPITDKMKESVIEEGVPLFKNEIKDPSVFEQLKSDEVKKYINRLFAAGKNTGTVHVVESAKDIPAKYKKKADVNTAYGFYDPNTDESYFITGNIKNVDDALKTWIHEVGVHKGLTNIIPENLLNPVFEKFIDDIGMEEIKKTLPESYWNDDKATIGEEYLTALGEKVISAKDLTSKEKTIWNKMMGWVRDMLNKLFKPGKKFTVKDAEKLVKAAIQSVYQMPKPKLEDYNGVFDFLKADNNYNEIQENKANRVNEEDTRGGIYNTPIYRVSKKVQDILKNRGIDKNPSLSETRFGNSIYYTVYGENSEPSLKIRISDHGVTNKDRIFNEQHESSNSDPKNIANDIERAMYPERYEEIETGKRYYSIYDNAYVLSKNVNKKENTAWVKSSSQEMNEKQLADAEQDDNIYIENSEFLRKSKTGNKIHKVSFSRKHKVKSEPVYKYKRKDSESATNNVTLDDDTVQSTTTKGKGSEFPGWKLSNTEGEYVHPDGSRWKIPKTSTNKGKVFSKVKDIVDARNLKSFDPAEFENLYNHFNRKNPGENLAGLADLVYDNLSTIRDIRLKKGDPITNAKDNLKFRETIYGKTENVWHGNRDFEATKASIEASNFQDRIKKSYKETKNNDARSWQDVDKAIHVYLDMRANPDADALYEDKLSNEQKRMIGIAKNLSPEQKEIAKEISDIYEEVGAKAKDADVIHNIIDNYVSRVWDLKKGTDLNEFWRKFGTKTGHAKQRKFETIIDGWANGYNLKVEGATNNLMILKKEISDVVENRELLKKGLTLRDETGMPLFVMRKAPGYAAIEHPNFKKWQKVKKVNTKVPYSDPDLVITKDGEVFQRRTVYAPEAIAKRLNNALGKSRLNEVRGVPALTKVNAVIKATILSWSFFHHMAFMRSYYLPGTEIRLPRIKGSNYKDGLEMLKNMTPEVETLIRNGLTIGRIQDWDETLVKEKSKIGRWLDNKNVAPKVREKVFNFHESHTNFLFNKLGAGLKTKAAVLEYQKLLKEHPEQDPEESARQVAELLNNDFGGLHHERLGRNKTAQHLFRLAILAPDWTESNVRSMVKAFGADNKTERKLYQKFWAGVFVKTAFLSVVANLGMALAGTDDEEEYWETVEGMYKDAFERPAKLNWLSADITPVQEWLTGEDSETNNYFSIMGHFRDPIKFITDPVSSLKHKSSVVSSAFLDALTGSDWSGRAYTSAAELAGTDDKGIYKSSNINKGILPGDPKGGKLKGTLTKWNVGGSSKSIQYDQLPSFMLEQLRGVLPVPVQNAVELTMGEIDAFDALTHGIGFHVSKSRKQVPNIERDYKKASDDAKVYLRRIKALENENKYTEADIMFNSPNFTVYSDIKRIDRDLSKLKDDIERYQDEGYQKGITATKSEIERYQNEIIELSKKIK